MELRDRLLYCIYGIVVGVILLSIWPGPQQPDRFHRPAHPRAYAALTPS